MFSHVAVGAKGHQVIERVVAQLAPLDLVVDLQVLQRAALLTSPAVGLQHPVKQLVAGWQVNGITTFASGQPLTAYMPGDWANLGGSAYPDLIANPNLPGSKRSRAMNFNTTAFAAPPAGSFGTSGRNNIIGPGINDFDFSFMKNFPMTEHQRLEFCAELFNIFNHANFLGPGIDTTFSDPTFGVVSSASDGREIQFGLKFMF
jgi:hypothetical protein